MSMTHAEEASADLARAANLNFRLAELLEQHDARAVLTALATACEGAVEASGDETGHWTDAARLLRKARFSVAVAEKIGSPSLEDACRVLADVELGE